MIGKYNKSVWLTYLGVLIAIFGISLAIAENVKIAVICLILSAICDLFDGVIARKCIRTNEEKEFGVQIDSLADMISFVALPIVIGNCVMQNMGVITPLLLGFYGICGIIRLAWFNMNVNKNKPTASYQGLPVTYSALIFAIIYLSRGLLVEGIFTLLIGIAFVVTGLFFIINIKIPKPRGIWYAIFSLLAIAMIIGILFVGV